MIRSAGVDAAERLAELHASAFDAPWSMDTIAELMAGGALALACNQGFILVRVVADEAEVLPLAVEPTARRNGLGRALVEAAAKAVRDAGAAELFLEVAADNAPAIALYTVAGFNEVGRRRGYYARGASPAMDALVLRRSRDATA